MNNSKHAPHRPSQHPFLKGIIFILFVLTLLVIISPASARAPERVKVLIAFKRQPGLPEQALVRRFGGQIKYTYQMVPGIAATMPETALAGLSRHPSVDRIEPDRVVHVLDAELDNTWGVKHIGAGEVHATGNQGFGIKVGVFDTGIDTNHPDLTYEPSCSHNFVEGETLEDGHSHGTHVAGTIAAHDNDAGVVGVAPDATLCIYKVFDSQGNANYSDIVAAMEQAIADDVDITNHSWGDTEVPVYRPPGAQEDILVEKIFNIAYYEAGILHVAGAGNNSFHPFFGGACIYPALWLSVISVGAIDMYDGLVYFSSVCDEMELTAPGLVVTSTMPGESYGNKSGTSMASPHVAGTAALVWAANPGWTNDQVRQQLQATAKDLGPSGRDKEYGFGRVDAAKAVDAAPPQNVAPVAYDQSLESREDEALPVTLSATDDEGESLTYTIVDQPDHGNLMGSGANLTYDPDQDYFGADQFTFIANDGIDNSNIAKVLITLAAVNDLPTAEAQSVTVDQDTPLDIALNGDDVDGDPITYALATPPAHGTLAGPLPVVTYTPDAGYHGLDEFTFTVADAEGSSDPAKVSITVIQAPTTDEVTILKATYLARKRILSVEATSSAGRSVDLIAYVYDSEGTLMASGPMDYFARRDNFRVKFSGIAVKPFQVEVISTGGGSAIVEGGQIDAKR